MEEKGLIRRAADENDQRQKRVMTTEKGRELREQVQTAFQDAEAAMFPGPAAGRGGSAAIPAVPYH